MPAPAVGCSGARHGMVQPRCSHPLAPAAVAAGVEVARPERQRRRQSYFVRVGSLSAKLRHRALRRSLGELQWVQHSARRVLAQLHRIIELVRMRWGPCQPCASPAPPGVLPPCCPFS